MFTHSIIDLFFFSLSLITGKTCLCQQFLQQKFVIDHKETVDEMHSIELNIDDRRLTLEILDTAGIDEFPVMRRIAIAHGDAFLIVYAVDDAHSFEIARQMRQLVLEIKGGVLSASSSSPTSLPIVIVANKCDIPIGLRQVNLDYAESIVRGEWITRLVESTCYQRASVLNVFHILLQMANINLTFGPDGLRRSSDPSVSTRKEHQHQQRVHNKRQSCAQQ
jgi:GTPase KRas